jgi:hypothetical protein
MIPTQMSEIWVDRRDVGISAWNMARLAARFINLIWLD